MKRKTKIFAHCRAFPFDLNIISWLFGEGSFQTGAKRAAVFDISTFYFAVKKN